MSEELFTANRLALLSRLDRRAVERKLVAVAPMKTEGKARYYSLADALPALAREPADAAAEERLRALREREQAARTESAELDAEAKAGKICYRESAKMFVAESIILLRKLVERADFMTQEQKVQLLEQVANAPRAELPEPVTSI